MQRKPRRYLLYAMEGVYAGNAGAISSPALAVNEEAKNNASVVKLVDTPDSKSGSFTGVAVQVRPLVPPIIKTGIIDPSLAIFGGNTDRFSH